MPNAARCLAKQNTRTSHSTQGRYAETIVDRFSRKLDRAERRPDDCCKLWLLFRGFKRLGVQRCTTRCTQSVQARAKARCHAQNLPDIMSACVRRTVVTRCTLRNGRAIFSNTLPEVKAATRRLTASSTRFRRTGLPTRDSFRCKILFDSSCCLQSRLAVEPPPIDWADTKRSPSSET